MSPSISVPAKIPSPACRAGDFPFQQEELVLENKAGELYLQPLKIKEMPNHPSAEKRTRQTARRRLFNRYWAKTTRNAIRKLRANKNDSDAKSQLPKVISLIDKLAKRGYIHKNKAANLKSGLMKRFAGK
ncbi:MAG: 30S ribosomal protein S20 [Chitinophagales bacterium]|nr:30S ribosomal protein S20 [Chitinophagales bacterium]MDW8418846.1 30S ribosomal protein S20 [Chitinophagales bacterium]